MTKQEYISLYCKKCGICDNSDTLRDFYQHNCCEIIVINKAWEVLKKEMTDRACKAHCSLCAVYSCGICQVHDDMDKCADIKLIRQAMEEQR